MAVILALDPGERRTGISISDATATIDASLWMVNGSLTLGRLAAGTTMPEGVARLTLSAAGEIRADSVHVEIGSRIEGDDCFYPDDDMMWVPTEDGWYGAHKDGTPYDALKDMAGSKAEVMGTLAERDGMKVVTVTGSKAASSAGA